jgi:hypothetical protein
LFNETLAKTRATRAFLIFSALFFIVAVGTGFVIAADRGYGAGPWDSHSVWSCYTPGGPYYLHGVSPAEQPCPGPTSTALSGHGRLAADLAPRRPK